MNLSLLPDNSLRLIFSYLDYEQLLVIRTMSPKFSSIVDKMTEERPLWLKKIDENRSNYYRFFCIKKTSEHRQFNILYSLLEFKLNDQIIHSRITKLITYNPFVLSGLRLDNLLYLDIKNNKTIGGNENEDEEDEESGEEEPITLNLCFTKLRTLCFQIRSEVVFVIDANNLTQLKASYNLEKINLLRPKSVKTLCVHELDDQLNKYDNLSKLFIDKFIYKKNKETSIVNQLTKLRELQISDTNRSTFDRLLEQRQECNPKLKIYYKNINVDDERFDFETVDQINAVSLDEKHYAIYLSFIDSLKGEFKQTNLSLNGQLGDSLDLLSSFVNIRCLHIQFDGLTLDTWIRMLSSLKLNKIYLLVPLEQAYLDVLPTYCENLNCLSIKQYDNLDFLFKLKYLERVSLPDLVSLDVFEQIAKRFIYIKTIRFNANPDAFYRFEFAKDMIIFYKNTKKLLAESKAPFLKCILKELNSWTDLIQQNGNAICEK